MTDFQNMGVLSPCDLGDLCERSVVQKFWSRNVRFWSRFLSGVGRGPRMTRATRDGAGLSGRGLLVEDRETSRNPKLRQPTQSSANTNIFTTFDKGLSEKK